MLIILACLARSWILKDSIARFHSRDTFSAWWSTPNGNTVVGSSSLFIIGTDLMFDNTYIQFDEICLLQQGTKGQYV